MSNHRKALFLRNNNIERVEQLLFYALDVVFCHLSKKISRVRIRRINGTESRTDGHHRYAKNAVSGNYGLDQSRDIERKR